jgi:transposase-like protein
MTTRAGRPLKLNHAIREQICKFIALGVSLEAACEQEGIARSTFYQWLRRGREALEDAEARARTDLRSSSAPDVSKAAVLKLLAASDRPFVLLMAAVEQAQARAESDYVRKIAKAADKDWRAAAWWLERRRPDAFGNRETLRVQRVPALMTNDELIAELQELGFVNPALSSPTR